MFSGPALGLFSAPNPFNQTPAGTLAAADNVFFSAPGVLETRRGNSELENSTFGTSESRADTLAFYGESLIVAYDGTTAAIRIDGEQFFEWDVVLEPYGANRLRFEGANNSVFMNPATGIHVYDGAPILSRGTMLVQSSTLQRLAYTAASGTLDIGQVVNGAGSGSGGIVYGKTGIATGYLYITTNGAFDPGESLTCNPSWAATAGATDFGPNDGEALISGASVPLELQWTVTGLTSGATGVLYLGTLVDGTYTGIVLINQVGTFTNGEPAVFSNGMFRPAPIFAGNPLGISISTTPSTTDGWQTPDTAVAYRFTICSKDRFNRIIEGPPSGRAVARNGIGTIQIGNLTRTADTVVAITDELTTFNDGDSVIISPGEADFAAGPTAAIFDVGPNTFSYIEAGDPVSNTVLQTASMTRAVAIDAHLPGDDFDGANPVTTQNFLRFYRSHETLGGATDTPLDDLYLCHESPFLGTGELGVYSFYDTAPQGTLVDPLYTNPNDGGSQLVARYQPPASLDIAQFSNRMWFANTTRKHSLFVNLIGVGSPEGIQVGDVITWVMLRAPVFTFWFMTGVSGTPSGDGLEFQVFEDGEPGFNIERTANSIIQAMWEVNDVDEMPYGYYVSPEGGVPGQMYWEARAYGDAYEFTVSCDRPTAFTPQLTEPLPTSSNDIHPARLWYSELGRPEAVPLLNYLQVDSDNDPILRIFPLHYRLIIFKTSGIYYCTNVEPFSLQRLSDYVLLAPDSVVLLDDKLYALTDQGIITVSDSGVTPTSIPIDNALTRLTGPESLADYKTTTVAVAYRSERQCLVWMIQPNADGTFTTQNAQAYVYSTLSGGFTRYPFGVNAAVVDHANNKLILAPNDDNVLWAENKTYTADDFTDLVVASGSLVDVTGTTLELASVDGIEAGDVIASGTGRYLISAVDADASTITTLGETGWTASDAYEVHSAIECEVTFNKLTDGQPARLKMNQQCSFLFAENGNHTTTTEFASEISIVPAEVALAGTSWGMAPYGEFTYGGATEQIRRVQPLPIAAAECAQLTTGFSTRQAYAKFEFLGVDVVTVDDTEANRG